MKYDDVRAPFAQLWDDLRHAIDGHTHHQRGGGHDEAKKASFVGELHVDVSKAHGGHHSDGKVKRSHVALPQLHILKRALLIADVQAQLAQISFNRQN